MLYGAGTVDELIYEKADWEQFVGADRNDYFLWSNVAQSEPIPRSDPPRRPPVDESKLDASKLVPGQTYPGDSDQGPLYSLDTQGTVRDENGHLVKPSEQLDTILSPYRRKGGRFRVTPRNHFVTKLEKTPEGWHALYLGRLDHPLEVASEQAANGHQGGDLAGSPYPLARAKGTTFSVLQRDKRLIARKVKGRVEFVLPADTLTEPEKQSALREIQRILADVYARGHRISKITVTNEGHVVYVFDGQAYFVGVAPEGAEGFVFEEKNRSAIGETRMAGRVIGTRLPCCPGKDSRYTLRRNSQEEGRPWWVFYEPPGDDPIPADDDHATLVKLVNGLKMEMAGTEGGPFSINEHGQVIARGRAPEGQGNTIHIINVTSRGAVSTYTDPILFQDGALDPQANPKEGGPWSGPLSGMSYKLARARKPEAPVAQAGRDIRGGRGRRPPNLYTCKNNPVPAHKRRAVAFLESPSQAASVGRTVSRQRARACIHFKRFSLYRHHPAIRVVSTSDWPVVVNI